MDEELGWELDCEFLGISEEFLLDEEEKNRFINIIYNAVYDKEITKNVFFGKEGDRATFNWVNLADLDKISLHPREKKKLL